MKQYIENIAQWFSALKDKVLYNNMIKTIQKIYDDTKVEFCPVIKEHIVWFSFQVFRYIQTLKVKKITLSSSDSRQPEHRAHRAAQAR